MTSEWRPISTAPHDGTTVLVRRKNGVGRWQHPCAARYAKNTVVENPALTHFWSADDDENGHPNMLYFQPLEWKPLEEGDRT